MFLSIKLARVKRFENIILVNIILENIILKDMKKASLLVGVQIEITQYYSFSHLTKSL